MITALARTGAAATTAATAASLLLLVAAASLSGSAFTTVSARFLLMFWIVVRVTWLLSALSGEVTYLSASEAGHSTILALNYFMYPDLPASLS